MNRKNRRFNVESIGPLYWKSLELFATRLEDADGRRLEQGRLEVNDTFYVIFPSGTGLTRTSGVRIS